MKTQTPNAKRVAAYQKRQSEKVAGMKAALERIGAGGDDLHILGKSFYGDGRPSKHDECIHGYFVWQPCCGCISDIARQALAPTDGRGEG